MGTSPNGRPVKAKVELWIGPNRCVHELIYDCMNGLTYPLKSTLQFKKLSPVLKVSTDGTFEFPLETGVFVPSPEESKKVGAIYNKGGAIRSFNIDPTWEQTQIMVWSA